MDRRGVVWPDGDVLSRAWSLPKVEVHAQVASTQDRAFELAKSAAAPWSAVLAAGQSAGRGRRGDRWESDDGLGLWISLVLPPQTPGVLPIPLRLGVLLAEAVERAFLPQPGATARVTVKWPNDVWIAERKVAGILSERAGGHTIGGLGLNLFHRPSDFGTTVRDTATSMALEGWSGDPVALVGRVLTHIREGWDDPTPDVLERLRVRDALAGRAIETPDGRQGRGAGVDEDGALRVCGGGSEWRVLAGAVTLLDLQATRESK